MSDTITADAALARELDAPDSGAPAPLPKGVERLLGYDYQGSLGEHYRGLHFTDSGKARLSHTAGFLQGLSMSGKRECAITLATELDGLLSHLASYGGEIECPMDEGTYGAVAKFPSYKVVLGDDGTFGGFSLMWYRCVTPKAYMSLMEETPRTSGARRTRITSGGCMRSTASAPSWSTGPATTSTPIGSCPTRVPGGSTACTCSTATASTVACCSTGMGLIRSL